MTGLKKNVKTVFTYLELHKRLSLTARKIQGQKAHPQDLQTVRRYTLMLRWTRHEGREDNIFQF